MLPGKTWNTMGLSSIDVGIKLDEPKKRFTSGDMVTGKAYLNLRRSKSIQTVQIVLRCTVHVAVRQGEDNYIVEDHHLYEDKKQVFPAPEFQLDNNSSFTLAAGVYEYPISFKLPPGCELPESLDNGFESSGVFWNVEIKAIRSGVLSTPSSAMVSFQYTPCITWLANASQLDRGYVDAHRSFDAHDSNCSRTLLARLSSKNRIPAEVKCRLSFPEGGLQQAPALAGLGLEMQSSIADVIVLESIKFTLRSCTVLYVRDRLLAFASPFKKTPLAHVRPGIVLKKDNDLDHIVGGIQIQEPIPGSIHIANIDHRYELVVEIALASRFHPRYVKKLEFKVELPIVPCQTVALPAYSREPSLNMMPLATPQSLKLEAPRFQATAV